MPHNKGTARPQSEQWQILWGMRWESGTKKRWLRGIIVESPGVSRWTREAFNNREMGEGRYNLFLEWNILGSLGLEHPETMPHRVGGKPMFHEGTSGSMSSENNYTYIWSWSSSWFYPKSYWLLSISKGWSSHSRSVGYKSQAVRSMNFGWAPGIVLSVTKAKDGIFQNFLLFSYC